MVDMWMLSVAAALTDGVTESEQPALAQLEQAIRAVPDLGNSLDALRSGAMADRRQLTEALADGLKAAYDEGGEFADRLENLWPEVLFGPKKRHLTNVVHGNVGGLVVQAQDIVGGLNVVSEPKQPAPEPKPTAPAAQPAANEVPSPVRSWFGLGRRDK